MGMEDVALAVASAVATVVKITVLVVETVAAVSVAVAVQKTVVVGFYSLVMTHQDLVAVSGISSASQFE